MIFSKILNALKSDGVFIVVKKIVKYPFQVKARRDFETKILSLSNVETKFTLIYKKNFWGSKESVSGGGSTLQYTENLRKELPALLEKFSIRSIFDAPCGDFNWMKELLPSIDVIYIGADIVSELIDSHNQRYKNEKVHFLKLNLIADSFPDADLMICRDCLFHLSYDDVRNLLKNFVRSNISYLLTTTHKNTNQFQNRDIKSGDCRSIDLFSAPFNFPQTPLARIDDWVVPYPEREMCLWSREQIAAILK